MLRSLLGRCFPCGTKTLTWVTALVAIPLAATVTMPGQAGATTSPQIAQFWVHGSQVSTSPVPDFAPQQSVEIKVPANSVLQPGFRANILMCGDPGAQASNLPISDIDCDGITINVGRTLDIVAGGTVDKAGYVIYQLPTRIEPTDSVPVCNASHACVLYVGQDQNDFSRPHVWSTPFYVGTGTDAAGSTGAAASSASSGSSAPLVGGIVAAVVIVLAGGFLWLRHKGRRQRTTLA